jgi:hypothetical protein
MMDLRIIAEYYDFHRKSDMNNSVRTGTLKLVLYMMDLSLRASRGTAGSEFF